MMKLAKCFVAAAAVMVICAPQACPAQQQVIFRIGQFNGSSREFDQNSPKSPVVFEPKTLGDGSGWYARQRLRVTDPTNTVETAPRTIVFSLRERPRGSYVLRVAILVESPCVPMLHADVNGKVGSLYFFPKLDYRNGDRLGESDPIYSHAETDVQIPAGFLHNGRNTLTLQAVGADADLSAQAQLFYDAVELDHEPEVRVAEASASLHPTVYFRDHGDGLEEEVDAVIDFTRPFDAQQSVSLTVEDKSYRGVLGASGDFGEVKVPFYVPEFAHGTSARLTWQTGGKQQRLEASIDPSRKWTIYVVPHVHLDVGFTDYQAKVAAEQSRIIDEALEFMKQNPDFRFSLDGSWNIEQFMHERTAAQQQEAIAAIRNKHLFVPAQYANVLTGLASTETLIRSLYPSADFSRHYGTPFNYANIADVPSYSWSYASVLASAGIHDFVAASNNTRAPVLLQGNLNQNSPFWWEGPDGQKVLMWYSRTYLQMQYTFGLPPTIASGRETIPVFLQAWDTSHYRANSVIMYGTQVENTDLYPQQAKIAELWNREFAYPKLRYSGFYESMQSIAKQFGDDIPVVKGDGAPYWEDGAASDALYTAMERQTEASALSAEKLATLSTELDKGVAIDMPSLRCMWKNIILMDEHTWGAFDSVTDPTSQEATSQLAAKDKMAIDASAESEYIARNGMATIAGGLQAPRGSAIVFNLLNWPRSGFVEMDVVKGARIVDRTNGLDVPYAITHSGTALNHVRFLASEVPALGYKIFGVEFGSVKPPADGGQTGTSLESPWYRVVLDPATGAVISIYDKDQHREIVDRDSPYRFGEYLYVTGGDQAPNNLLSYSPVTPSATLTVHPATGGRLVSVRKTPWGEEAMLESSAPETPKLLSEIEVFDHEKKIEFREEVVRTATTAKEAAYFAFPFAADHPSFHYEIQNGVVDPATDLYPGAGHEWFSVQHWVSVEDSAGRAGTVMPLDAPLVTLGDINRGLWPDKFTSRDGTVFSYIMNNYWFTNYRASQGGTFHFRYVVTSGGSYEPVATSRRGWEEASPLEVDQVRSQDVAERSQTAAADMQRSFLKIGDPAVFLETWKPAEDGNGTILRLLDLGGKPRIITLQSPLLTGDRAWLTNAVETGATPLKLTGSGAFEVPIHSHEIVTVRLAPAAAAGAQDISEGR